MESKKGIIFEAPMVYTLCLAASLLNVPGMLKGYAGSYVACGFCLLCGIIVMLINTFKKGRD